MGKQSPVQVRCEIKKWSVSCKHGGKRRKVSRENIEEHGQDHGRAEEDDCDAGRYDRKRFRYVPRQVVGSKADKPEADTPCNRGEEDREIEERGCMMYEGIEECEHECVQDKRDEESVLDREALEAVQQYKDRYHDGKEDGYTLKEPEEQGCLEPVKDQEQEPGDQERLKKDDGDHDHVQFPKRENVGHYRAAFILIPFSH